ncbi:MAG: hypothetical protein AAGB34_03365 [Planctomycetota bacterium]
MREITIAGREYAIDNDDRFPMSAARGGDIARPTTAYCSWMYGGATTHPYWARRRAQWSSPLQDKAGGFNLMPYQLGLKSGHATPHNSPGLNTYIYPELVTYYEPAPRSSHPLATSTEPVERKELDIFNCPSDNSTFQRSFSQLSYRSPELVRDSSISTYEDVGTSYQLNISWVLSMKEEYPFRSLQLAPGENYTEAIYEKGLNMFRAGSARVPTNFAWLKDEVADVITSYAWSMTGMHGGTNKTKLAFFDGSVHYLEVKPGELNTGTYSLSFRDTVDRRFRDRRR